MGVDASIISLQFLAPTRSLGGRRGSRFITAIFRVDADCINKALQSLAPTRTCGEVCKRDEAGMLIHSRSSGMLGDCGMHDAAILSTQCNIMQSASNGT